MTAQWVMPSWPEAYEHFACWLQERAHHTQNPRGVGEMLKCVYGDDYVRNLRRRRYEETSILNTRTQRLLSCGLENVLPDINTDHPLGPSSGHLYGISSFATAEVDDNFACNLSKEFIPHQNRELRLTFVNAPATAIWGSGRDPL